MTATTMELHAALIWAGEPIADVVLAKPGPITIGPAAGATFTVPDLGLPEVFPIVSVGERGYLLTMGNAMAGTVSVGGVKKRVTDLVGAAPFAATPVGAGDWGVVDLDGGGGLQLFFQVGGRAERIATARRWDLDTILPATAFSVVLHLLLIISTFVLATGESPFVWPGARSLTGRYLATRIATPPPPKPVVAAIAPIPQPAAGGSEQDQQPKPPKQSPKAGLKGSDQVRPDAPDQDAGGQVGLNSPKAQAMLNQMINTPNALTKWSHTRGKGGHGSVDDTDNPGTTHGDPNGQGITKQGDLDTTTGGHGDGGRGHGHGNRDGDGTGIGPEIILRPPPQPPTVEVVCTDSNEIYKRMMSHKGLFGLCFQKALDHDSALGGTIDAWFTIGSDGRPIKTKLTTSDVRSGEVKGCVDRTLKSIRFPEECNGALVHFPLVFNAGGGR